MKHVAKSCIFKLSSILFSALRQSPSKRHGPRRSFTEKEEGEPSVASEVQRRAYGRTEWVLCFQSVLLLICLYLTYSVTTLVVIPLRTFYFLATLSDPLIDWMKVSLFDLFALTSCKKFSDKLVVARLVIFTSIGMHYCPSKCFKLVAALKCSYRKFLFKRSKSRSVTLQKTKREESGAAVRTRSWSSRST